MNRIERVLAEEQTYAAAAMGILDRAAFIIRNGSAPNDAILQLVLDALECGIVHEMDLRYVAERRTVPGASAR